MREKQVVAFLDLRYPANAFTSPSTSHPHHRADSLASSMLQHAFTSHPCRACDARPRGVGARSSWRPTWRGDDAALAQHAPDGGRCLPYKRDALSLRARSPRQRSSTPSRATSVGSRLACDARPRCVGARSSWRPTWRGDDAALAQHAPDGGRRLPYKRDALYPSCPLAASMLQHAFTSHRRRAAYSPVTRGRAGLVHALRGGRRGVVTMRLW